MNHRATRTGGAHVDSREPGSAGRPAWAATSGHSITTAAFEAQRGPETRQRRWWFHATTVMLLAIAFDLAVKAQVTSRSLFHIYNDAYLLGTPGPGGPVTTALVSLTALLLYVRYAGRRRTRFPSWAVGLSAGGGCANAVERLLSGRILDFIALPGHIYVNLADIMVLCGLLATGVTLRAQASARASTANQ
jgi:lipoprotein signal peptidase